MFDYIPRILLGILLHWRAPRLPISQWHAQKFRVWPFLDTDGFRMLAVPKFITIGGCAAWVHAYLGGFLKVCLRQKWTIVTRRTFLDFYRPIWIFRKIEVRTKVVAIDTFSILRVMEFHQDDKICARFYMQLVVLNRSMKKMSSEEWLSKVDDKAEDFGHWPDELAWWKAK